MSFIWHYFLSCFALWTNMLINGLDGVNCVRVGVQGLQADLLPNLTILVVGIFCLWIALLSIGAAVNLLRFKSKGIEKLHKLNVISVIVAIIDLLLLVLTKGKKEDYIIKGVALALAFIILKINKAYYEKRYEYFDTPYSNRTKFVGNNGGTANDSAEAFSSPANVLAGLCMLAVTVYYGYTLYQRVGYGYSLKNLTYLIVRTGLFFMLSMGILAKKPGLAKAGAIFGLLDAFLSWGGAYVMITYGNINWEIIIRNMENSLQNILLVLFFFVLIILFSRKSARPRHALLLPALFIGYLLWAYKGRVDTLLRYMIKFPTVLYWLPMIIGGCLTAVSMVRASKSEPYVPETQPAPQESFPWERPAPQEPYNADTGASEAWQSAPDDISSADVGQWGSFESDDSSVWNPASSEDETSLWRQN